MNRNKLCIVDDGWGWAMPDGPRSRASTAPISVVAAVPASIAIAPSPSFIRRSRNPDLPPPARFEPTPKSEGDVVI